MISNDLLWKAVIEDFFQPFFEYFFPDYINDVDWTRPVEYLDTELSKLQPKENIGKKVADKLIKVYLKNGDLQWFIIHVEVQGQKDINMAKRMFKLHNRIKDKYEGNVTCLLLLVYDKSEDKGGFEEEYMGTKTVFTYNVHNLVSSIENSEYDKKNIFSFVTRAAYINIKFQNDEAEKFKQKDKLFREFFRQKSFEKSKIRLLLNFINDFIRFTNETYQTKNIELLETYSKTKHMGLQELYEIERTELLTKIEKVGAQREKRGIAKGMEKGIEKGMEKGMEKGIEKGIEKVILNGHVNGVSVETLAIITGLEKKEVMSILKRLKKT
jgi:predicted transposase YdaD